MFKEPINLMLMYLFVIVLLFCMMYLFIYNDKNLTFDNTIKTNTPNTINTFEKFNDNDIIISGEQANTYLNSLNSLIKSIEINEKDPTESIGEQIESIMKNINSIKDTKDEKNNYILNQINNIYWKRYLENINQANAYVFNEYLKYSEPEKNKFYQQYL